MFCRCGSTLAFLRHRRGHGSSVFCRRGSRLAFWRHCVVVETHAYSDQDLIYAMPRLVMTKVPVTAAAFAIFMGGAATAGGWVVVAGVPAAAFAVTSRQPGKGQLKFPWISRRRTVSTSLLVNVTRVSTWCTSLL